MKRHVTEELLDQPGQPQDEVQRCLNDLRGINRRMGGNALHLQLLQQAVARRQMGAPLHLLEVASGRADVLQHAALALQADGIPVELTLLDRDPSHFPTEDDWEDTLPQPTFVIGDAMAMPFADDSVDIISCCLFTHHLEPAEISEFLHEALRVTRIAVVINDLERNYAHWLLAYLGRLKYSSRFTAYDAPVSIRRSYTLQEMRAMLAKTGHPFECRRAPVFRLGAILWK